MPRVPCQCIPNDPQIKFASANQGVKLEILDAKKVDKDASAVQKAESGLYKMKTNKDGLVVGAETSNAITATVDEETETLILSFI